MDKDFRVWAKTPNVMLSDYLGFRFENNKLLIEAFEYDVSIMKEVDPQGYVVMWYSGVRDSDNKKIYEADLVAHEYIASKESKKTFYKTEIVEIININDLPFNDLTLNCKVIGNIYEDPELLLT